MKLIQKQKNFMNTVITIKFVKDQEATVDINNAIEKAFGEFDRIVKKFTRFNENSELSNLNRNSGQWTQISEEFFFLINKMLELHHTTKGAFDPTVIDFLEAYGYDKNYDFSKLENPKLDENVKNLAQNRSRFKDIEIDSKNYRVKLMEGQRIDLGGIGKGYAIDCAYEQLIKIGENFLIDGGGDIRANGKNQKTEIWKTALRYADMNGKSKELGLIELKNEALASSGSWARKVKQFHHIINPLSGKPVEADYSTVFVKAPTAIEADAWATSIFVAGKDLKVPESFMTHFV